MLRRLAVDNKDIPFTFTAMPHLIEPAASGRSKCRGCGVPIRQGELRFGECLPNPYAEGDTMLWFHPACAAYQRAEPFLEALGTTATAVSDREKLENVARASVAYHRLARIDGAERARSGQATCRSCRRAIPRDTWRVRLVFYQEGRFAPGGYVHLECRKDYFETEDILDALLHFGHRLDEKERELLRREFRA
jgi:hypothetical protein